MMQSKVVATLALGFIMGLGLVSCTSVQSTRSVSSDTPPRYSSNGERREEKTPCQVGETRDENGNCVRPYNFDRPFRRGGR